MTSEQGLGFETVKVAIESEIIKEIERTYEATKKEFLAKLERDMATTLAGVSLHIMKYINMEQVGPNIVITLRTKNEN